MTAASTVRAVVKPFSPSQKPASRRVFRFHGQPEKLAKIETRVETFSGYSSSCRTCVKITDSEFNAARAASL
jgi:hypothetical protein